MRRTRIYWSNSALQLVRLVRKGSNQRLEIRRSNCQHRNNKYIKESDYCLNVSRQEPAKEMKRKGNKMVISAVFFQDHHDTMLEVERIKQLNVKALLIQKVLRGYKYR